MSAIIPDVYYNDRSTRGRLRLTGRDRQSFLQGMVTNDVLALKPGEGCYAFLLDPTGHVLADVRVLATETYLLLDTEPGMATFVAETLERYLIMEKCRITDVSEELAQIYIGGERSAELMQDFAGFGADNSPEGANIVAFPDKPEVGLVAATRWTTAPGFDLFVLASGKDQFLTAFAAKGADPISDALLESLRIEAGIPRYGIDIDPKVLAPETGQQSRAIAYRKGCYIGQEIVARIDARGHANRTFAGFALTSETLPANGTPVEAEGREVGRVTSSTISPTFGHPIAIGYIRNEFAAAGTDVTIAGKVAEVEALPFEDLWDEAALKL